MSLCLCVHVLQKIYFCWARGPLDLHQLKGPARIRCTVRCNEFVFVTTGPTFLVWVVRATHDATSIVLRGFFHIACGCEEVLCYKQANG